MRRFRCPSPWLLAVLFLLGLARPASAAVFCVATAVDLHNALTTAAANGQDDEIRIVQGTYVGNFVYASTQANKLRVLGGYTSGCASRTLDPVNTVLDGNQTNTVLVLSAPNVAAEFLVEGLTLLNGNCTSGNGGGLYAQVGTNGKVTVANNTITGNTPSTTYSKGGGLYLSATTTTLSNNTISSNTARSFGGAYIYSKVATLTNNSISGNSGGGVGLQATDATLTNNSITGNTGLGGLSLGTETATLTYNTIKGNTTSGSETYGGGLYLSTTIAILSYNTVSGNTASASDIGSNGGGIALEATTATLTNNTIAGNTASSTNGSHGGGLYLEAKTATLINNEISDNIAAASSSRGGGLYLAATTATLTNNTIASNAANEGGGLRLVIGTTETTDTAKLYNNLFWANITTANQGADLWINNDGDGDYLPTPVTLLANNFDQSAVGFKITLPITIDPSNPNKVDPLFVDANGGDFHLQPGSPMIDAGYPGTPDLPEFDIAGTPRVLGNSVDIGAYEFDDGSDPKAILALTLAGTGSGQVTSNPTGIDCGTDCFQAYDINTLVTLTATPADANSSFAGWSGDADCTDGQVTMTTNINCIATFMAQRWLTVTRAGQGKGRITSVPAGIDCGTACQAPFAPGTTVKLTAIPDAISTFAGWSGAGCPNPRLNLNRSCRATFNLKRFWLYTFVVGTGGGQVTSNPAGIRCGADCEQEYVANTLVTLRAVPNALSRFTGWAGPCTGTAPTCKVKMSQVRGVAAIFDLKN